MNLANLQVKEVFQLSEDHKATITGADADPKVSSKMGFTSDNDNNSNLIVSDTLAEPYE